MRMILVFMSVKTGIGRIIAELAKKATIKLETTGRIKLTMHFMTPRIAKSPVIVTISTREGEIGEVTLFDASRSVETVN